MGGSSYTVNPLLYKSLNYDQLTSYDYLGINRRNATRADLDVFKHFATWLDGIPNG